MKYIGIDPDVDKSGIAIWDSSTASFTAIETQNFFDVLETLLQNKDAFVRIEAGWLNKKSNFHLAKSKGISDAISRKVGENHMIGKLFENFCVRNGIKHSLSRPTKKKYDKIAFTKTTGYKGRTNQDSRDAAMLVYGF